jgi:hypothetical protein
MTPTDELRVLCAAQNVGLYLSNSLHAKGQPWIFLKSRGTTIAEFSDVQSALHWFPRQVHQPALNAHF